MVKGNHRVGVNRSKHKFKRGCCQSGARGCRRLVGCRTQ
jgi:hypothetical protein